MKNLLLAVLLTGFSLQVVVCTGVQTDTASGSDDASTHFRQAFKLGNNGDLDGAIAEYRTGLRLNPNDEDAHYNLGLALKNKGNLKEAIAEFRAALFLKPNDLDAHFILGDALKASGDLDGAIAE